MPLYLFGTEDPALAAQAVSIGLSLVIGAAPAGMVGGAPLQPATAVMPSPPAVPPPAAPPQRVGPPAGYVPSPPAAAPPAPPPAAAPAPPPPAPAAQAVVDNSAPEDQAVLAAGWTSEYVANAARAFTKQHGAAGPGKITEIAAKYLPPNHPRPVLSIIQARYWPQVFAELTAGMPAATA